MFDSTTSLGFNLPDILAQVGAFLSIPVVSGLVITGLALYFAVRLMNALRGVVDDGYLSQPLEDIFGRGDDEYGAGETWHEKLYRRGFGFDD